MSKPKAKMCIVTNSLGLPLSLVQYQEGDPYVLAGGDQATVFPSSRAAKDAIYTTKSFARRYDLPWKTTEFSIGELEWSQVEPQVLIGVSLD
jgi:hypothetical protein